MSQALSEGEPYLKRLKSEDQEQSTRPITRAGSKKNQERLAGEYSQKTNIATMNRDMNVDAVTSPQVRATIKPVVQVEVVPPQVSSRTGTSESAVNENRSTKQSRRQSDADSDSEYHPEHGSASMSNTVKLPRQESKPVRKPRASKKAEKPKLYGGTLEQEIDILQHVVAQQGIENTILQDHKKDLESKGKQANKELRTCQKKIEELKKEVEKVRTAFSKLSTDRGPPAEDDEVVRFKFGKLFEAFKDWSEKHAITSFDEVEARVLGLLRNDIAELYSDRASDPDTGIISRSMWSKGGKILLSSLLVHEVVEKFFKRPFFFLEKFESYGKFQTEAAVHSVLKFLDRRNQAKAQAWRAATVQVLTESEGGSGREKHLILNLRKEFCFDFAQTFLANSMVLCLLPEVDEEAYLSRSTELLEIVMSAAEFACELWKQKPAMTTEDKCLGLARFYRSSLERTPHPSMLLEEDDKRFDDRVPDMVIFPGIKAWGNEKGENYTTSKIWFPTVVYFFDDPETMR